MRFKIFKPVVKFRHHLRDGRIRRSEVDLSKAASTRLTTGAACPASQLPDKLQEPFPEVAQQEAPQMLDTAFYSTKEQVIKDWSQERDQLFEAFVSSSVPSCCMTCGKASPSLVVCEDCGPSFVECDTCSKDSHANRPLHYTCIWDGSKKHRTSNVPLMATPHTRSCPSKFTEKLKVYDSKGRYHVVIVQFCRCKDETKLVTLIKLRLWPASAKHPSAAYHIDLLKLLNSLTLECQVAVKGFVEALKHLHGLTSMETESLYRLLQNESNEEFKRVLFRVQALTNKQKSHLCPICPQKKVQIVSMDGNFGLVRKKSSGASLDPQTLSRHRFVEDETVDSFIATVDDSKTSDLTTTCSDFQAGSKLRNSRAAAKLHITGVFGSVCRHEIPLRFLNMKHGERYGYPTVLLKDIMSSALADTEFKITYDIACVFSKYVKKRNLLDSERCSWAVPVFHGYGHIASCQVSFSPRRIPGFGLLDGEAIERLWSYLRRFAKITKEMTPGHRLNLLSQGLDHFSKKKEDRLDKWLVERVIASEGQLDLCSADIASLQQKYKVPLTDLTLNEMISEEQEQFKKTPTSASGRGWRSQYIKDLLKWYSLRDCAGETLQLERNEIDQRLQRAEDSHNQERWTENSPQFVESCKELQDKAIEKIRPYARDRQFLISLLRKYNNGQETYKNLQDQIKKTDAKIKKVVRSFNGLGCADTIDEGAALSLQSNVYSYKEATSNGETLPAAIRRQLLDSHHMQMRAREEIQMCTEEMSLFCSYLREKEAFLNNNIELLNNPANDFCIGLRAHLLEESLRVTSKIDECSRLFSSYINVPHHHVKSGIVETSPVPEDFSLFDECPFSESDSEDSESNDEM